MSKINMEEPKKTLLKQEKNNNTIINIGKAAGGGGGGGGIGVGIIILGGAVVSATAAFLIRSRLRKSCNSENCKHDDQSTPSTEVQYKIIEDKTVNQDKELHSVVSDSSPDIDSDRNSSNGTAKSGVHEINNIKISDQSFLFLDENYKLEANGRKQDPVSDCEGIILSDSQRRSENPMQLHTSAIKEEEPPLLIVQNQTFLRPTNADDDLSTEEIEFIKEDNATETGFVDQGREEERQHMQLNIEGEYMKINCRRNEDTKEFNCQEAAEITKADNRMHMAPQSREEQECPIHSDQAIGSTGGSLPKTAVFVGKGSFLPGNSSFCKDEKLDREEGSLAFGTVEIIEKDEALDVADADQKNDDDMIQLVKIDDSMNTETLEVDKTNGKLEASQGVQGNGNTPVQMFADDEYQCDQQDYFLTIGANEASKSNEAFEANDENQSYCSTVNLISEGFEEVKVLQEADGKDKSDLLLIEGEKGGQHDEEITGEENQATAETGELPVDNASASNKQKLQIEEPETLSNADQKDNSFSDDLTSENCGANVPNMSFGESAFLAHAMPEIQNDNDFAEVQQFVGVSKVSKENVAIELATGNRVVESKNLLVQLAECQHHNEDSGRTSEEVDDTFQMQYAGVVIVEDQSLMRQEEDSIDDEGDEAKMFEKVEDSSEETGDSSAASNSEAIWPAESCQELIIEQKELKLNEEKEKQEMEGDETVKTQVNMHLKNIDDDGINEKENSLQKGNDEKGNLKMTVLERHMRKLRKQFDQSTNSKNRRILMLTILVLSGVLVFLALWPAFLEDMSHGHPDNDPFQDSRQLK